MTGSRSVVTVGRIAGPYGVRGWVRVASFTDPADNVFAYAPWTLRDRTGRRPAIAATPVESKAHGKGWIARLDGVADRDAAEALKGLEIVVDRSAFPEPDEGSYYWADLEGLQVIDQHGRVLGRIDHMLETGSADVMVIVAEQTKSRCLIPFIVGQTVTAVDLQGGNLTVDWDE